MKVNANHNPTSFTKTHGKLYFNENIVQSEETDEMTEETRTVFNYDQVEITSANEAAIMQQAGDDGKLLVDYKASEEHHFASFKEN